MRREAPNYIVRTLDAAAAEAFVEGARAGRFAVAVEDGSRPRKVVLRGELGAAIAALLPLMRLHPRVRDALGNASEIRLTWRAAAPVVHVAIGPLRAPDVGAGRDA